jgi:general secretion pathway protein E
MNMPMNAMERMEIQAIAPELIRAAQVESARTQQPVCKVLEQDTGLPADRFTAALGATLHFPVLGMEALYRLEPAFDVIPFSAAAEHGCLALRDAEGRLLMAFGDPFDTRLQAWVEEHVPQRFEWYLAHASDISAYLTRHEESMRAMDSVIASSGSTLRNGQRIDDLSIKSIGEETSTVVKLVHSTLYDALNLEASDIHLETGPTGLIIKYRIDGVLNSVSTVDGVELAEQVISRIKIISELDIAERRVPQDGRFKVSIRGREVDFRVSIMPSIFGEDAVLRILDKKTLSDQANGLSLDSLGFDEQAIAMLRQLANAPYGMMLVTGPTGSGKTTTLYGAISEINHGQDKIVTIEDPVEYQLRGVLQIPVNEKKGLTFARGLRSILRHDPDKIMVGEIRDPETAQIAIQSALTGHLVLTTVHANNVFDVIGRFMHMGVDLYSFVSAINGILAQRLVRINCPHCSVVDKPDAQLLKISGIGPDNDFDFRIGRGCGQCRGSGFKGRKAIAELLYLNDELREMIVAREPIRVLKEFAHRNGTHFLRESAVNLVRRGETTLQEINRVTFVA